MSQLTLTNRAYHNSNLFSSHYLDEPLKHRSEWDCDEEAQQALEELQTLYELEGSLVEGYKEDALIDNSIDKVLDILGYGTQVETTLPKGNGYVDILLFENDQQRRKAATIYLDTQNTTDLFNQGIGLVEAKQWDADFNKRFSEQRPYRDASHQIKHYLENVENIEWGILTNGRKWRIYGTKDYETKTYYEVDLPELLEQDDLEQFKYFYTFFRPEAFQETSGSTFLETVWTESETASQELGEDLQDNVFTALRVLGHGFVETNNLDINPDDTQGLDELKEQSLVLLYRLMFVLYAESRNLIHPEGQDSKQEYEENFSLDQLRLEIHETIGEVDQGFENEYSEHSTTMWRQLEDLFRLIDKGEKSLGIPPYNGGLFDQEKHTFLAQNTVSNRHLAEVIYRLSTTENEDGRYVLADYADLDTRHLGSVYEGLLEHQFRIATEDTAAVEEDGGQVWKPATDVTVAEAVETIPENGLYVVNDEGERKATGAYYTPDYIVTYIVEETVDPLIDEIREDLTNQGFEPGTQEYLGPFLRRVTELKILDPAMGSGHFLTRATGYLTEQVMNEVREVEEEMGVAFDEQHIRREIAKECIYGVDLNGMAVELAKLSMWLDTLAADRPLAFLDHHLKTGNSLVGSDVTQVLSTDVEENGGQLTLQQSFARVRERTLDHVMDLMQELLEIDNETLEDVKSMEEIYNKIRDDPFYQRLLELTNVHAAELFDLDVPEDAYETMAAAIEDEEEWGEIQGADWFQTAQSMGSNETFFHWELEYPEVFFNADGEKKSDAGFDAVVGNPPYIRQEQLKGVKTYLEAEYDIYHGVADLYVYFIEKATNLLHNNGYFGQIISNKFMRANYGKAVRKLLTEEINPKNIIDFGDLSVFESASAYPSIIVFNQSEENQDSVNVAQIEDLHFQDLRTRLNSDLYTISTDELGEDQWSLSSEKVARVNAKLETCERRLEDYIGENIKIRRGVLTGFNEAFFINQEKKEELIQKDSSSKDVIEPLITGKDVRRYYIDSKDRCLIFTRRGTNIDDYPAIKEHLEQYKDELKPEPSGHTGDWNGRKPGDYEWYEIQDSVDYWEEFETEKICYPVIANYPRFVLDTDGYFLNDKCFIISKEDWFLIALLNSKGAHFWFDKELSTLRGGYYEFRSVHMKEFPIPRPDAKEKDRLEELAKKLTDLISKRNNLNTRLLDHLGSYSKEQTLEDTGFVQPPKGSVESVLTDTSDDRENLRVGDIQVNRESLSSIEIQLSGRYKPENEDDFETDRWGYTETELLPALQITDLSESEADLIEAFVPVAVDEAGGFANFRETATQTMSLVDRLRRLEFPDLNDVRSSLDSYLETMNRAEELDEAIGDTNQEIDKIVYSLYELSEQDIEVVEEAISQ